MSFDRDSGAALAELGAIRAEMAAAADSILAASEAALALCGDNAALAGHLCDILEATAFQDLTGQRITRVETLIRGGLATASAGDGGSLENGPALPGRGLAQGDADALLAGVVTRS